ncbi:MAG TPA: methanogenesis marker 2 protein [Methanothrix sp.]|nr:methanogenesis marker 2 protein [Methanothrix sp.]
MNLESIASELRGFVGITRKKQIGSIMQFFPIESERIIASFGEDAAVIDDGEEVMLLAADGIWSKLMEVDPEWSGYCSVLVNVHDIAAMGGWPVAMVDVLSVGDGEISNRVLKGMKKGIEKFHVPIIGGHLHPDTPYNALDVAILGKAKKSGVILSSTAKAGEVVVAAADMDGHPHPKFAINFDSTSFKDSKTLLTQLGCMQELGEKGLVRAGKDISNPGLLGTLGMLLETSGVGAVVDVEAIAVPSGLDLVSWLKMYPGMGFVVTTKAENADAVIEVFQRRGLTAHVIGRVTDEKKLVIRRGFVDGGVREGAREGAEKEEFVLFDFEKECVTGIH